MRPLIVLGLFPLFSASPIAQYSESPLTSFFSSFSAASPIASSLTPFFGNNNNNNNNNNLGALLTALFDSISRVSNNQLGAGAGVYSNSQNLGQQARRQADSLISTLRDLARDPRASKALDRVFNNDAVCLKNMEEAIQAIQEGSRLMTAAERDLNTLISRVEGMMKMTDEVKVMREVASLFRLLDPLLTKLSPNNPSSKICAASSESTSAYINSLAVMMNEFSGDFQLVSSPQARGMFAETASILVATNGFLRNLKTQTKEFQNSCFADKESTVRGVRAMRNIIDSLADMAGTLGNLNAAEEIRKADTVTDEIVTMIQKINTGSFNNVGLDCVTKDFNTAADTMDDIASLVQDIGLDNLKNQLGEDFDFNF